MLEAAAAAVPSEPAATYKERCDEADRLARHAWSVDRLSDPGQAALCLSGGGIRSAAFALGILQGLARRDLLGDFHYMSTVSGGGYIGSWLTAWRCRKHVNLDKVLDILKSWHFGPEDMPFQRLRFNQNFLTPKVGLGSADSWTAIAVIVRNLALNWLVFLPLLLGLLLAPRFIEAFFVWMQQGDSHSSLVALLGGVLPHADGEQLTTMDLLDWRSWADSAAIVLILFGFTVSASFRPAGGAGSLKDSSFVAWVVLPVLLGTILLAAAAGSWLDHLKGSRSEFERWAVLGAIIYVVARLTAEGIRRVLDASGATARRLEPAVTSSTKKKPPFLHAALRQVAKPIQALARRPRPGEPGGVKEKNLLHVASELLCWAAAGLLTGALVGLGAWLCYNAALPSLGFLEHTPEHQRHAARILAVAGPPWILSSFLAGEVLYAGLASRLPYSEEDREWLARAAGWFGAIAVGYFAFAWLVLFGWDYLEAKLGPYFASTLQSVTAGAGVLSLLGALTPLTRATTAAARKDRFSLTQAVAVLSAVFILGAIAWLASLSLLLLDWLHLSWLRLFSQTHFNAVLYLFHEPHPTFAPLYEMVLVAAVSLLLLLISASVSAAVNINWFSLHAFYRNRLVKTFLGASNVGKDARDERRNEFDGFSDKDNLTIAQVSDTILEERRNGKTGRLYPIINVSLNVLATKNLAWQERKAEPFVFTPLFMGGDRVSYRPSRFASAGAKAKVERSISVGTAMAISGAAVSPNWGYHSSPITSFLMMLANVRLGWWLGNPKRRSAWRHRGPRFSWRLFMQEALGWTDDDEPWLYLSDGGHFENLGIYEMVRRRCRVIVVSDAGADPNCTLEDLGNAVRKISIDLGVSIEFERIRVQKRSDIAQAGVYCAVGTIEYPEGGKGSIIYFKPGFYGLDEPADVRAYAAANAKFPHESTLNQWFGESQFESYRSLGAYVIKKIGDEQDKLAQKGKLKATSDLGRFVEAAKAYLEAYEARFPADGANVVEIRKPVPIVSDAA
jgi:hypothetical protein